METTLKITGDWSTLKSSLKQKFPTLTDADLTYTAGKETDLVSRLSKKLGKTPEEVTDLVYDLQNKRKDSEKGKTGKMESGRDGERSGEQKDKSKKY